MWVCLLHCLRVHLRNGYTRAYAQIKQHGHTHKAVDVLVKANRLLSRRRQSDYSKLSVASFKSHLFNTILWQLLALVALLAFMALLAEVAIKKVLTNLFQQDYGKSLNHPLLWSQPLFLLVQCTTVSQTERQTDKTDRQRYCKTGDKQTDRKIAKLTTVWSPGWSSFPTVVLWASLPVHVPMGSTLLARPMHAFLENVESRLVMLSTQMFSLLIKLFSLWKRKKYIAVPGR